MLLRIAQADAYCMATEFLKFPRDQSTLDQALKFERFLFNPKHKHHIGRYGDDTQMSLAIAEALLDGSLTEFNFSNSFVSCYLRDKRLGYSKGFQSILDQVKNGKELLLKVNYNSDKNGAAMRAVPIGVLPSLKEVIDVATMQAKITHNTIEGIEAAVSVAVMSHFALYEDQDLTKKNLIKYYPKFSLFENSWTEPVVGPHIGIKTAHAVFELITTSSSLIEILTRTILWSGDTDSVAAIAWGIASARMKENVPDFMEYTLEPGRKFGVDYLKNLGIKLMNKFN